MNYLLDVSIVVARLDESHTHHQIVKNWMKGKPLAVCPITELGAVRVLCSKSHGTTHDKACSALKSWLEKEKPRFVPCDVRALDGHSAPGGSQTTDYYFGNLAEAHGMKWATLDGKSKHPAAELVS